MRSTLRSDIPDPRVVAMRGLFILMAGLALLVGVAIADLVGSGGVLHSGERAAVVSG